MKKRMMILFFMIIIGTCWTRLQAADITLCINGIVVDTQGVPPVQIKGCTLVPARTVFSELGAMVDYKTSEKKVYIDNGETLMVLEINHDEVWVNGETKKLNVPAQIIQNKLMIPLRFISETLGYQVEWSPAEQLIAIQAPVKKVEDQIEQPADSTMGQAVDDGFSGQDQVDTGIESMLPADGVANIDRSKKVIVIDPGHGGMDSIGTTYGDIYEKDITIQMGNRLTELLENNPNVIVYETRKDDTYVGLNERAAFSNEIMPDLFVSIHINSADNNTKASGTETYCYNVKDEKSRHFAEIVQQALVEEFGTVDRGVKTNDYVVLKQNKAPSVLIEIAFLSNEENRNMMLAPDFTERYAQTVYKCILEYFGLQ